MLIKSVKITNVLSFIDQDVHLDRAPLLVAIGPNGSGKSNFIEIVNKILERVIVLPVKLQDDLLWQRRLNPDEPIRHQFLNQHDLVAQDFSGLPPHLGAPKTNAQIVAITVQLSATEQRNVKWVIENIEALSTFLAKSGPTQAHAAFEQLKKGQFQQPGLSTPIELYCQRDHGGRWQYRNTSADQTAAHCYVRWFKVLRWAAQLSAEYPELRAQGFPALDWPRIGELLTVMGAHRSYHNFSNRTNTQGAMWGEYAQIEDRQLERSNREVYNDEPVAFELFRRTVSKEVRDLAHFKGMPEAVSKVMGSDKVARLNQRMNEFLRLQMRVVEPVVGDTHVRFEFYRDGAEQLIYNMSSGEKAILHLIFAIYWSGSRDVMLIIDEPELHLHPQYHRSFMAILRAAVVDLDWRVLLATHSPGFISEDNQGTLLCFRRSGSESTVHVPVLDAGDTELLRLLDYDNTARLMFARKVVLVEGTTDAFFFAHLLRVMTPIFGLRLSDVDEIAFFSTAGKGERLHWSRFLEKLDIRVFSVSDLDAVLDGNPELASQLVTSRTKKRIDRTVRAKGSRDGFELYEAAQELARAANADARERVAAVCARIACRNTDSHEILELRKTSKLFRDAVKAVIAKERGAGHMILERGELEDYVGLKKKGFDVIVEFCRDAFQRWFEDRANEEMVSELTCFLREVVAA